MDNPVTTTTMDMQPDAPTMGFFERLIGIYFEPKKTFDDLKRKRSWVGIYILLSLVTIGATFVLNSRMDRATYVRKSMENPIVKRFMNPQQMEAAIKAASSQQQSAFQRYSPIVTIPLALYVGYLIIALIFLLVFMLAGAGINFRKSLTVTFWGMGPPALILTLLGVLFMFIKDPQTLDINFVNNVVSNPGPLADQSTHPVLHSLLSSIDIFSVWTIALLSIGFASLSETKLTTRKAATALVSLWVVWILLKMGFWAIMG